MWHRRREELLATAREASAAAAAAAADAKAHEEETATLETEAAAAAAAHADAKGKAEADAEAAKEAVATKEQAVAEAEEAAKEEAEAAEEAAAAAAAALAAASALGPAGLPSQDSHVVLQRAELKPLGLAGREDTNAASLTEDGQPSSSDTGLSRGATASATASPARGAGHEAPDVDSRGASDGPPAARRQLSFERKVSRNQRKEVEGKTNAGEVQVRSYLWKRKVLGSLGSHTVHSHTHAAHWLPTCPVHC